MQQQQGMWLPLAGLCIGIGLGLASSWTVPPQFARYTAVAVLSVLDSLVGGTRATLEGDYSNRQFVFGVIGNTAVALLITYLGDRLGSDLYVAAVVAFGIRLFGNVSQIQKLIL